MKVLTHKWFILIVLVLVVAGVAAFTLRGKEKTQYFTGKAERGDLRAVVEATGTINAVTTVQVGSQVSGNVSKLFADFNSRVKKGQVIARIDPSIFEGNLNQAQADMENAKANLAVARANLEKSKATALQAKQDLERTERLTKEGVMSQQQLDLAQSNYDAAAAQVNASQAQVTQASAQIKQRGAAVQVAQTNVNNTIITAPIDGTVVNRNVDVGQTVAASMQAPTLFTIAQDLTKMQVYAKTDESDVGMIRPGQKVTFKVDAFPKDVFTGEVVQVRMNATTVQNVVTYDTVVEFANPEMKLFPGMTAYVTIPVSEAEDALKIPNGALRYRPDMSPDELKAVMAKYGMDQGGRGQRNGATSASAGNGTRPGGTATGENGATAQFGARKRAAAENADQADATTPEVQGPRQVKPEMALVWKLRQDKSLEPVQVRVGITDHTMTEVAEVLKGDLKEGDELVIGAASANRAVGGGATPRPGMGGGAGGPRMR
ncbi:MAG TPA: efflux RND transporter periplasmic adaptor subunit [Clostridia bacterium]|nr:efflux RND transporter periplasmic adaptor subunit [Clostridia bacterium]